MNPSGVHVFKRGDIVKMFFDTGAFGAQYPVWARRQRSLVPRRTLWCGRAGLRNRLEQGRQIVALVEDTELLEEARKGLRRAGVLKETGVRPDAR